MNPIKGAKISEDGAYRYLLTREWSGARPMAAVCMINPSTADANKDDATIRSLYRLTSEAGYGGFIVVNLFAFRSTEPAGIMKPKDPIGPDNPEAWNYALSECPALICGWGDNARRYSPHRATRQIAALKTLAEAKGLPSWCWGKTKLGEPRHPLYLATDAPLERMWPVALVDDI